MKRPTIIAEDLRGVFAVPPLARKADGTRSIDFEQNNLIVRHIVSGGIVRLIYGGNAFLYHISLREYAQLLDWLADLSHDAWVIPSLGPDFGRAMDQARLLKNHRFPSAMILPCSDPRDVSGLERGYREIADAAKTKLILYLKDEHGFGEDKKAGLAAVARLVDEGVCIGIKYAVTRVDPSQDLYLQDLLQRVDRKFVVSGIGERPAIVHLRDWQLPGFTTGSGCIAPRLSGRLFEACRHANFDEAERLRSQFIPLEDLRDAWNPAKVLHAAVELAGISKTGSVPPYLSTLSPAQLEELSTVARTLSDRDSAFKILEPLASTLNSPDVMEPSAGV